jgi:hypothetical protein
MRFLVKIIIITCFCLSANVLLAQDIEVFLGNYPTWKSMSKLGQDTMFKYYRQSNIFERQYLETTPYLELKNDFHAFFQTKLSAKDLIFVDEYWEYQYYNYKNLLLSAAPVVQKKNIALRKIIDSLEKTDVPKLLSMREKVINALNEEQIIQLKDLFKIGYRKYEKSKERWVNRAKRFSYPIDSADYVSMKLFFSIYQKIPADVFTPDSEINFSYEKAELQEYFNAYNETEVKLNNLLDECTNWRPENAYRYRRNNDFSKLRSLVFMIGQAFPNLNNEAISKPFSYKPKQAFTNSILKIQNIIDIEGLFTFGMLPMGGTTEKDITFVNQNDEGMKMVAYILIVSENEKNDFISDIIKNNAINNKLIENESEDIIYHYTKSEQGYEIEAIKIKKGETVAMMLLLPKLEKDVETAVKQYMGFVKL